MHYVCSDLHGRFDKYQEVISRINTGDTLFILDDVIDRYPDGIKILKDVIAQENVMLFIGNHEDMMYKTMVEQDVSWTMTWLSPCNGGLQTFNSILYGDVEIIKRVFDNSFVFLKIEVNGKQFVLSHASFHGSLNESHLLYGELSSKEREQWLWESPFRSIEKGKYSSYEEFNHDDITFIYGHTPVQFLHDKKVHTDLVT